MGMVLVIALAIALLAWCAVVMTYVQAAQHMVHLTPSPWDGGPAPRVSIIVPARNEAHQIAACLDSLTAQDYPDWELVVVDDRSEDETHALIKAAAARDARVAAIRGDHLPEGWMGKSWANHQGVARASGEYFLFTDADTWHHPNALSSAMRHLLASQGDAMTLIPFLDCRSFWEKLIQPAIIFSIAATLPLERLEDPRRPEAIFNGQFILIRRSAYEAAGGHGAIRASVVDDLSLAEKVKASGGVIRYPVGVELMKVRMYTTFAEIWKGWSKNIFAGARGDLFKGFAGLALIPVMHLLPWFTLPYFAWIAASQGGWLPTLGAGLSGMVAALTLWSRAKSLKEFAGLSPLWALLHPLAYAALWAIFANSMWQGVSGRGPEWKGRVYPGVRS